jgi:hypothetical protein
MSAAVSSSSSAAMPETDHNKENAAKKSKTAGGGGGYQTPWVEKYRPQSLDDVVGNDETLVRLRAIAKDGNMPNLILSGPPGKNQLFLVFLFCFWWHDMALLTIEFSFNRSL